MEQFFLEIVNRGVAASLLVLVLVLLRVCFKRMPKWVRLVLWGFVAFRLLCLISLETSFSLMPDVEKLSRTVEEYVIPDEPETSLLQDGESMSADVRSQNSPGYADMTDTTVEDVVDTTVLDRVPAVESNPVIDNLGDESATVMDSAPSSPVINSAESSGKALEEVPEQGKTQLQQSLLPMIWLVGMLLMAFYGVVNYLKVKHQVRASINAQENIYYCDDINTPFVFGLFKPGIYLPSGMEETTAEYVLRHEREHLRRGDQWWKLFGFFLLAVYWFHPMLWLAYVLFCKDIEFACDERVIKELGEENRREYAQALLSCSIGRRVILLCPTAFGENGVKGRIRSVMMYKKATIPILVGALVVCLVIGVVFLTDRRDPYGIDSDNIVMEEVSLDKDVAEHIAEDIAELMGESFKENYQLENFRFTFSKLASKQEENLLRVSVEVDKTSLRAPEESPVIQGMKKAQSELTYEAEQTYAQRMIDSMLLQLQQEAKVRICEPAIFVSLDEKNHYELYYGDANRTPLKEYFKKEDAEQEELLGYLSVYQKANIQPPMDVTGSSGYIYVDALKNPETQMISVGSVMSGVNRNNSFLYYKECAYDDIAVYEVKDKEKLPWELLGEEIKTAYSNNGEYWSERDALLECTGTGTLYQVKGYEDSYRVAIVYEQNWRNDDYMELQLLTTGGRPEIIFQSVIGQAEEEEIQPDRTTYHMVICEHINGLWFHEGREVFQQRMHLENAVSVNGLSMEEELLWNFLAELNAATFAPVTTRNLVEYETITFTDALGMEHSLYLYEAGYVKVRACETALYAKIDEEIFRRVMERVRAYEEKQPLASFEDAFPVQAVLNQEEGFETAYAKLLELAEQQLFNKDLPSAWFGETGYYLSKVPVYNYNIWQGTLNDGVNLLFLSKDFDKSSAAWLGWRYAEPTVTSGSWYHEILEMMKENPAEEYIAINGILSASGLPGMVILDANNNVCWSSSSVRLELTPKENLYQRLYSDELAISYEELTAEENLIWISVTGDVADATPTPTPTPIDISKRTYQTSYERSPYAAYSAEEWLKSGRLEVPFERDDVLNTEIMSERYAMWYIPEAALTQASTRDLARVAAFYYTWGKFDIYDRPSFYLDVARDRFNAFDALFQRENMVEAVLAEYEASGFYLANSEEGQYKKEASRQENGIVTLEIILATDEAFDMMNGKQGAVLQAVLRKMKLRESGMFYSEERTDGFFSYIKEHEFIGSKWYDYLTEEYAENKAVMYYLDNACYPDDSRDVWSPRPEELYVPTKAPEPAATEDAVIHTLYLPLVGKECRIEVIGKQREDTRFWGARELRVYAGNDLIQTILMQEAIDADGVDGIDKGYTESAYPNLTAELKDVNFDGYPDIEVWGWCPNNSIPYYYWCWNPETEQFEYAFTLQLTDVDKERKHLISYQKVGGGVYYTERYRVTADNKLELAERMTEEYWANTYASWREAYLHVMESFPDNMVDPYGFRNDSDWTNPEKYIYLGIHDFTTDGIPELIIGDGASLAVFTYKNGRVEKCIDVVMQCCWRCIDGVAFHENALLTSCSGSDGAGHTAVVYRNGAWTTGVYCVYHPQKCSINGEAATYEEFCNVVPFDPKDWEGTIKPHGRKKELLTLDETFDFELIRWIEK